MRRNVVFEKGRGWRVDDNQVQDLRLEPGRGAAVGEYAHPESSEYSDSYYGPGRAGRQGGREGRQEMRGVVGEFHPVHSQNRIGPSYFGSGEIHRGERSWADLGVSSVHTGDSGITEARQPSFRGRGPKGYRRSDERIRESVCEHLTEDPHLDASDIDVQVTDGEVTLTGFVHNRRAKRYAEDLAEASSGAAEVHNRLRVRR
jgi:osmotically-inducible protein OsmY